MAGDWIKMVHGLKDSPKVAQIVRAVAQNNWSTIGKLYHIWCWADTHTTDGFVRGVGRKWVDDYCEAEGFAEAMESVGWLVVSDDGLTFTEFSKHNGMSAKSRAQAALRQSKLRRAIASRSRCADRHARVALKAQPEERRGEERREEIHGGNKGREIQKTMGGSLSLPALPLPALSHQINLAEGKKCENASAIDWDQARGDAEDVFRKLACVWRGKPTGQDSAMVLKVCALTQACIAPVVLHSAVEGVLLVRPQGKTGAYLHRILANKLTERGMDLRALLSALVVPQGVSHGQNPEPSQ